MSGELNFVSAHDAARDGYRAIQKSCQSDPARGYDFIVTRPDHILIVGEDPETGAISRSMQRNGYRVSLAAGSDAMWAAFDSTVPDAVLLDTAISGSDGLTLCRKLRAHSAVPVIMLGPGRYGSACVAGLEAGADDYVVKPLNPRGASRPDPNGAAAQPSLTPGRLTPILYA